MVSALQHWVDAVGSMLGLRVVPAWRLPDLPMVRHLGALFELHGIDTVLDVGANAGQYRDFLRHALGFRGTIHSFEPISALAQALEARRGEDRLWHVHHYALGRETVQAQINVMAKDDFSSLRAVSSSAPGLFRAQTVVARTESITLRRLDEVLADLGLDPARSYLKLDTQGFDLEVLAGAPHTVARLPALQLELAIQHIYEGVPDYREVLTQMEGLGFVPSALFPVSCDRQLRAVEFDCVLVRR